MKRRTFLASIIGASPLAVSGCCFLGPPPRSFALNDSELTYRWFRRTLSFGPADGMEAFAPLPVHQFDANAARSAGAELAIEGKQWLGLGYHARNDLLLDLQPKLSWDGTLVHQVASADIWWVPLGSRHLFNSQTIMAWNWTELEGLSGYRDTADYGRTQMTLDRYMSLTEYGMPASGRALAPITFIHDVGPVGWQAICEANGWSGFVLGHDWPDASPGQRTGQLLNTQNYLNSKSIFQGETLKVNYAISIPLGRVYPVPEAALWKLRANVSLKDWSDAELAEIPKTVGNDSESDRPIRSDFIRPIQVRVEF